MARLKREEDVGLPRGGSGTGGGDAHGLRREEKQKEEEEVLHEEKVESKWKEGRKVILRLGSRGADLTLYDVDTTTSSSSHSASKEKDQVGVQAEEVRKELGKVVGIQLDPAEEENGKLLWSVKAGELIGAQVGLLPLPLPPLLLPQERSLLRN